MNFWRNHSLTIVGLAVGGVAVVASRYIWPDGGVDFDLLTLIGGIILSFGIQGIMRALFREIRKDED